MSFKDTIKKMLASKPQHPIQEAKGTLWRNLLLLPVFVFVFVAFINAQGKPEIREAVGVDTYNVMAIIGTGLLVINYATNAANAFYAWRRAKRSEIRP